MTFLSLHGLSFQLPDSRLLFQNLDLAFGSERTGIVGRNGVGKSCLLSLLAGELSPSAGLVRKSGKVAVLRQMAQVAEAETVADLFSVRDQLVLLRRIEAGEADVDEIAEADWTLEARFDKALSDLGIAGLSADRLLSTLSGGQRARAALAALVFQDPDIVLLDEPSNNLDREGRMRLRAFLSGWKGGAVVVSHDRELLNQMDRIIELSSLGARIYGGGFDAYRQQRDAEMALSEREVESAERQARHAARSAQQARERQARRDATAKKARSNSSDPKILLDARQQRAEATAARGDRLAGRLEAEAQEKLERSRAAIERTTPFTAGVSSAEVPSGKVLLEARNLQVGYTGGQRIGEISFDIVGPQRIAVAGPNGVGKSTLLKTIAGMMKPLDGTCRVYASIAFFDQHVSLLHKDDSILDNYRRLNPGATEFECRSALARYAFRADAALQLVSTLSGGERLRAGLACIAAGATPPELLILDEPTNHLDLDSIAEVEAGLSEFAGALLIVSHDETFLQNVGVEWRLELALQANVIKLSHKAG